MLSFYCLAPYTVPLGPTKLSKVFFINIYLHDVIWWPRKENSCQIPDKRNILLWLRDIASLCINLRLKTVQFSPPICGKFCEKLIVCFLFPKCLGLPVHTIYFVKQICLCPEEGLKFHYFNLTLGHFYTFNTWHSQNKYFHKVVDMVNIFHLQP